MRFPLRPRFSVRKIGRNKCGCRSAYSRIIAGVESVDGIVGRR